MGKDREAESLPGYNWKHIADMGLYIPIPSDWAEHEAERESRNEVAFYQKPRSIEEYRTDITALHIRDFTNHPKRIRVNDFADTIFMEVAAKYKVVEDMRMDEDYDDTIRATVLFLMPEIFVPRRVTQVITETIRLGPFHSYQLAASNRKTGQMYHAIFVCPESNWTQHAQTARTVMENISFDPQYRG